MAPDRQVALVTGCTQGGIGYELCKAFARANCRVFASARKLESMTGLPELGIETLQLDVTSADSRKAVVQDVVAKAGRIDILVNNAGMGLPGPIVEQDLEAVRALFDVNYFGLLGLTQEVVPHMARRASGKVVNLGSVVGYVAAPWSAAYSSSKAAVHSLTDALRLELMPLGIQVVLVAPGATTSNFGNNSSSRLHLLREDTLYPHYVQQIRARAKISQGPKSTPTHVLAELAVQQVLQPHPPWHLIYGFMSRYFRFLRWLPLWLLDRWWMKRLGIRPPPAALTT